jgi:hypothetical protein
VDEASESRERVERVETDETTTGIEERRVRLFERVVGPEDEEEGSDEVASARFRLRVSIQNPKPAATVQLADERRINRCSIHDF